MVSTAKRMRYVSDNEFSSSEDSDYPRSRKSSERVKSKGGLSRNAIMARENRLKKKMYISNLEKEVGDLKTQNLNYTKVIDSQSLLITDLKKEIKYLKSVIANSSDIGKLIRNIGDSTGMSVGSSLDERLSLNYVSKRKPKIASKTAHPWEERDYPNLPTPESELNCNDFNDNFLDLELNEILGDPSALLESTPPEEDVEIGGNHMFEHDYSSVDDVGVCLHVSKHRVSLEFCSTCSDNATQSWN